MNFYSANGQQLLLQNVNEQRNLGGLFSATAEWIRPVGSEELPTSIPTSLGEIEIFPEPAVSVGTDGFQRITATGYDIWDQSTYQVLNYTPGVITASIRMFGNPTTDPITGITYYEERLAERDLEGYFFEVSHSKKMRRKGIFTLPPPPGLKVKDAFGADITQITVEVATGVYDTGVVKTTVIPININVNNYGSVEEVEVMYAITKATVSVSRPVP